MVMAVRPEQRLADAQPVPGRTSNTGAERPCTVALISPWAFPARNTVINGPGATVTDGYKYPSPVTGFADRFCPSAAGKNAAHKTVDTAKRSEERRVGKECRSRW